MRHPYPSRRFKCSLLNDCIDVKHEMTVGKCTLTIINQLTVSTVMCPWSLHVSQSYMSNMRVCDITHALTSHCQTRRERGIKAAVGPPPMIFFPCFVYIWKTYAHNADAQQADKGHRLQQSLVVARSGRNVRPFIMSFSVDDVYPQQFSCAKTCAGQRLQQQLTLHLCGRL